MSQTTVQFIRNVGGKRVGQIGSYPTSQAATIIGHGSAIHVSGPDPFADDDLDSDLDDGLDDTTTTENAATE
ncbi:MAG: hypothetical protein ACTHXO_13740 [Actinomycetaceae bacterium]